MLRKTPDEEDPNLTRNKKQGEFGNLNGCGPDTEIEAHTDSEDEELVAKSVKPILPNGTIVVDLDPKEGVFLIQVNLGYCITMRCQGIGTCYFGGHSYMLQNAVHAESIIVHLDPTSQFELSKDNIIAIIVSLNKTVDENLTRHDRILSTVVTKDSVKHLILPNLKL